MNQLTVKTLKYTVGAKQTILDVTVNLPTQYRTIFIKNQPYYLKFQKPEIKIRLVQIYKHRLTRPNRFDYQLTNQFRLNNFRIKCNGKFIPLSNIGDDNVCLGIEIKGRDPVRLVKRAIQRFWTSRFESLPQDLPRFRQWVKYSQKITKVPKPQPIDWKILGKHEIKL